MARFYIVRDVYSGEWFAADEEDRSKAMFNLTTWEPKDEMRRKQFRAWLNARVVHAGTKEDVLVHTAERVEAEVAYFSP
jgi:hypothetical protein